MLKNDPVYFVHQYKNPQEQERVALISALLAFGNVKTILASVEKILAGDFTKGHRWVKSRDLKLLFGILEKIIRQHGSIKNFFLKGFDPQATDVSEALHSFSERIKILAGKNRGRSFDFLFPSPKDGSPCKRLNMFLRWMVRPADGIDLGLWPEIPTSKLIVPLDTHIYQFARRFKLSRRKNPCWQMAVDVTQFLKTIDPKDPVKYDFAICHYGMEYGWGKNSGEPRAFKKILDTSDCTNSKTGK